MFAKRLKLLRNEKKLKQKELAELLHTGISTIAGYEASGRWPDYDKIKWFCDFFDVSADYLLGFSEDRLPDKNSRELDKNEETLLNYFSKLTEDEQIYIKGKMIELIWRHNEESFKIEQI